MNSHRTDGFYKTKQWRALSSTVRKTAKAHGTCCGICGGELDWHTPRAVIIDHKKSRHTHPHLSLSLENLHAVDARCNSFKANGHGDDLDKARKAAPTQTGLDGLPADGSWS